MNIKRSLYDAAYRYVRIKDRIQHIENELNYEMAMAPKCEECGGDGCQYCGWSEPGDDLETDERWVLLQKLRGLLPYYEAVLKTSGGERLIKLAVEHRAEYRRYSDVWDKFAVTAWLSYWFGRDRSLRDIKLRKEWANGQCRIGDWLHLLRCRIRAGHKARVYINWVRYEVHELYIDKQVNCW